MTERALRMRARGASDAAIGEALDRTPGSVNARLDWITMSEERREKIRQRIRGYRGDGSPVAVLPINRPPEFVLAERDAIAALPMTYGQRWLGDPPPGRSALDRIRAAATTEQNHVAR